MDTRQGSSARTHVGDRNETLPTVNGFDELFGNLYHLNAEEEPELPDYPKDPAYRAKFGPRGVLRTRALDKDDPTVDPRFGKIGRQAIEDTGALTKKRMETIDDETSAAAIDFMKRQHAGYDQSSFLRSVSGTPGNNNGVKSARETFFYTDDDGLLVAMRHGDMKYVYAEQRLRGTLGVWAEPFTQLRLQKAFNLLQDPFERADITSNTFWDWQLNQIGAVYGVMEEVFKFAETFKEFPPRSFPPSFVPTAILERTLAGVREAREHEQNGKEDPARHLPARVREDSGAKARSHH